MTHKNILETTKQIESMDQIRAKSTTVRFQSSSTSAFAFGEEYIRWQTNRVYIMTEKKIIENVLINLINVLIN